MKMAQYRRGKAFCDQVAEQAGLRTLNQVWKAPGNLPTQAELEAPHEWVARVGAKRESRLLALFR
jgi:uncharacterized protein (DUF2342 family)